MHQTINGNAENVAIARAINELRCGRAVHSAATDAADAGMLWASVETLSPALLQRLAVLAGDEGVSLLLTGERARALGLVGAVNLAPAYRLQLGRDAQLQQLALLAGVATTGEVEAAQAAAAGLALERAEDFLADILRLTKHARLLPAVVAVRSAWPTDDEDVLAVSAAQLSTLATAEGFELTRISEARVPLVGHEDCRLVLFRDERDASEHVAVIIGQPQLDGIAVRLHSSCLTGDLLGSLRCDCGDQLRAAVEQLANGDGGVLLYLAQEGRGIGLANKLRAYQLQDAGMDTLDADQHLGFKADERNFAAAASMLRQLGMTRIELLTNNPEKMDALERAGIEVLGGQRLVGAVNRHNARYIRAKRERAGHLMPAVKLEESL